MGLLFWAWGPGVTSLWAPDPSSSGQEAVLDDLQGPAGWRLCRTGSVCSGASHAWAQGLALLLTGCPTCASDSPLQL